MGVAIHRQCCKVLQHFLTALFIDLFGEPVASHDLGHLSVQEMRRVP